MENVMIFLFVGVMSYLIGAIPTAFIFGKIFFGIDIREHGSGNVGATNAFRVLGKKLGSIVLAIDILKGVLPVAIFGSFFLTNEYIAFFSAMMAVVGHNWTCFLQFKGGKGVATSAGVFIGLTIAFADIRLAVMLCILLWIVSFLLTAYISVSSMMAAIFLPVLMIIFKAPVSIVLLSIIFALFVVFKHRPNIQRILRGQEPKVPLPFHKK